MPSPFPQKLQGWWDLVDSDEDISESDSRYSDIEKRGITPFTFPFIEAFEASRAIAHTYRCLDEQEIEELSAAVREKPKWWINYTNPAITDYWRAQLSRAIRPQIWNYVIQELEYYDYLRKETGETFSVGPNDYVYVADAIVPPALKNEFISGVARLENVPNHLKDWQPYTSSKVQNLVDPSLYPFQYKVTPLIPAGESVGLNLEYKGPENLIKSGPFDYVDNTIKPGAVEDLGYSKRFQWLPSLFDVSEDGTSVAIKSYINNLNPVKHQDLYQPIADIFAKALPGINACFSTCVSVERVRLNPSVRIPAEDDKGEFLDHSRPDPSIDPPIKIRWEGNSTPRFEYKVDGRKLRVITKLSNIVLTPSSPTYDCDYWQVQGLMNEDIVATVIYYYDSNNIKNPELAFRLGYRAPENCKDSDVRALFGLQERDYLRREAGSVKIKQDKMVIFANYMQHSLRPFSLADRSRKGHLKMLYFYIVDPHNKVMYSTDQVPPQQADWAWKDTVLNDDSRLTRKLPVEVLDQVFDNVKWPMNLKAAKDLRMQLARERFAINKKLNEDNRGGSAVFNSQYKVRPYSDYDYGHWNMREGEHRYENYDDGDWREEESSGEDNYYRNTGAWDYRNENSWY